MSYKKDKLIMENWRRFLKEEASASKVDPKDFPMKLSDVGKTYSPEQAGIIAKSGIKDGDADDDKVQTGGGEWAVKDLKPSQTSMNVGKAVAFAIAAILGNKPFPNGPGGDLKAIVSGDNHIMDGHHRWIASAMVNPETKIKGKIAQFPAKELIAILNILTLYFRKSDQGKPGGGTFANFTEEGFKKILTKYANDGVWSANKDPNEVVKALMKFSEATDKETAIAISAKKMADNISGLTTEVPSHFPQREDMPIISDGEGHLDLAMKLLDAGAIDINRGYAGDSGEPGGVKDQGGSYHKGAGTDVGFDAKQNKRNRMMRDLEENKKKRRRNK
jgi:hypothetical protein